VSELLIIILTSFRHDFVFATHSASVTAINVDAIMLSRRLITLLPTSHIKAITNCMPAVSQGLLVGFATLCAYCFRFPLNQNARLVQSLHSLCLYSGCSGLSCTSAEPDPGWPRKTVSTAFEVVFGWSVADAVVYDVIITARCRRSVRRLLVADLSQLDQLNWRTSMHLTQQLHTITVWGGGVDNFCVWIIRNCCPNYLKRKNNCISAKKSCLNY